MNNGGVRPQRPQQSRDNLYARTLTRHALLQSSLSLPPPSVARCDPLLPAGVTSRPIEWSPPFLSRSSNSLDILPPRHRPLFAARPAASSLALNEAPVCLEPDGACAYYSYFQQREPARLKRRCDSTSALARLKPKGDSSNSNNNNEWGKKLSK